VRLELSSLRSLHVLPDGTDAGHVHRVLGESPAFDKILKVAAVESLINDLEETSFDLGAVAVANRFQEQLPKWLVLEAQLPQDIENLTPERFSLLVKLL